MIDVMIVLGIHIIALLYTVLYHNTIIFGKNET
jgi:hypothetical protein